MFVSLSWSKFVLGVSALLACLAGSLRADERVLAGNTSLGDMVVLDYEADQQQLFIGILDYQGNLERSGSLQLNAFVSPPEVLGFKVRRTGELDLIVEVETETVRETALMRLAADGQLTDLSYTSTGNRLTGYGIERHGNGILIAGEMRSAGANDSAASLTLLEPRLSPKVTLQDTPLSNDRFIAVSRVSPDRIVALGLRQEGLSQIVASMTEFDGALNRVAEIPMDVLYTDDMDQVIAVSLRSSGFMMVIPDGSDQRYRMLQLDTTGRISFEQRVDFGMPVRPTHIVDLQDGRFVIDADIIVGTNPEAQGRMLALMRAGNTPPVLAIRDTSAAIVPSIASRSQLMDMIIVSNNTIALLPVYASQFEYLTSFSSQNLPQAGIGGLTLLGGDGHEFILQPSPTTCELVLIEALGVAPALRINQSLSNTAIGFYDNTVAIVGSGMTMPNGQPLVRIDLQLPDHVKSSRLAEQINNFAGQCR